MSTVASIAPPPAPLPPAAPQQPAPPAAPAAPGAPGAEGVAPVNDDPNNVHKQCENAAAEALAQQGHRSLQRLRSSSA